MEETSLLVAYLDARIITVVEFTVLLEIRGAYWRQTYEDMFGRNRIITVDRLWDGSPVVELWEPKELNVSLKSKDKIAGEKVVMSMEWKAKMVVPSASRQLTYSVMQLAYFLVLILRKPGIIDDCYITETSKRYSEIIYLEFGVASDKEQFEKVNSTLVKITMSILR